MSVRLLLALLLAHPNRLIEELPLALHDGPDEKA